jgi:hypothetical protein
MKQIQLVSPDFVSNLWDKIQPFFDASFKYSNDDYSIDQIKMLLVNNIYFKIAFSKHFAI